MKKTWKVDKFVSHDYLEDVLNQYEIDGWSIWQIIDGNIYCTVICSRQEPETPEADALLPVQAPKKRGRPRKVA